MNAYKGILVTTGGMRVIVGGLNSKLLLIILILKMIE
jgi:hypothetical protein